MELTVSCMLLIPRTEKGKVSYYRQSVSAVQSCCSSFLTSWVDKAICFGKEQGMYFAWFMCAH